MGDGNAVAVLLGRGMAVAVFVADGVALGTAVGDAVTVEDGVEVAVSVGEMEVGVNVGGNGRSAPHPNKNSKINIPHRFIIILS
ncbi:MAG: hypothetical protein GY805_00635 [Chloroflexi bacterium]|nr:hypothetical protein [Chloroflexota bacterium]